MDHAVDIRIRGEDLVKRGFIGDVNVVVGRSSAGQQFNAANDFLGRIVLIVNDDNLVASFDEGYGGEGTNIPRSTILELEMSRSGWRGSADAMHDIQLMTTGSSFYIWHVSDRNSHGRGVHLPGDEDRPDSHDFKRSIEDLIELEVRRSGQIYQDLDCWMDIVDLVDCRNLTSY